MFAAHSWTLQAGLTINSLIREGNSTTATFGGEAGKNFCLERSTRLDSYGDWQIVAGPIAGTNRLQTLMDRAGPAGTAFFRISLR